MSPLLQPSGGTGNSGHIYSYPCQSNNQRFYGTAPTRLVVMDGRVIFLCAATCTANRSDILIDSLVFIYIM